MIHKGVNSQKAPLQLNAPSGRDRARRRNGAHDIIRIFPSDQRTPHMKFLASAVLGLFLISGCTWVQPTPGGQQVRQASSPTEIAGCRKIGNTTVSLLDRVGYFDRDRQKVEEELSVLGRNSAAAMGGDTILPISEVFQGERSFAVYRCRGN